MSKCCVEIRRPAESGRKFIVLCFILKTSSCDKVFQDRRQAKHVGHRTENQISIFKLQSTSSFPLRAPSGKQETTPANCTFCRVQCGCNGHHKLQISGTRPRQETRTLFVHQLCSPLNAAGIGLPTVANLEGADLGREMLLHRSVYQVTRGRACSCRSVLAGHENMSMSHFVQTVSEGSGALFIRI